MAPTAEEIAEKIKAGFEKKKAFMPSVEDIKEKIFRANGSRSR